MVDFGDVWVKENHFYNNYLNQRLLHLAYVNNNYLLYGKVNPSVLIGSFLVGILPCGPFPRKRSKPCISLFQKPANLLAA